MSILVFRGFLIKSCSNDEVALLAFNVTITGTVDSGFLYGLCPF